MKVVTVVGARPQFIKAAPVSHALRNSGCQEYLVHTGQHYDYAMSQVFFEELSIPLPDLNLHVGSGSHGHQTGEMLIQLEEIIQAQQPDWVLVYGDTNSTLAGALAAVKLHIPVAHIEAGLRSFNRKMPEEHNRVLTDHCSDLLFCPTQTALNHLAQEGISNNVHLVGDTMYDAVQKFAHLAKEKSRILQDLQLKPRQYLLATVHRPYNTDDPENLRHILSALVDSGESVIFPVHPRTRKSLQQTGLIDLFANTGQLRLIEPVGYLDMLTLEQNARIILTDSGGIQKEAYFFSVPCITLRPETEWIETVELRWNILVGADYSLITSALHSDFPLPPTPQIYGNGDASVKIARTLEISKN